jgi:hypothetical protein
VTSNERKDEDPANQAGLIAYTKKMRLRFSMMRKAEGGSAGSRVPTNESILARLLAESCRRPETDEIWHLPYSSDYTRLARIWKSLKSRHANCP